MSATARDPRYASPGSDEAITRARRLAVGDRVRFHGESQARFKVQARDDRYVILTKPFNARQTYIYTVIDLDLGIRGCDDYHCLGYGTPEQCQDSLERFSDEREGWQAAEISVRSNVTLEIADVKAAA